MGKKNKKNEVNEEKVKSSNEAKKILSNISLKTKIIVASVIGVIAVGIAIYFVVDNYHDKKILEKSSIDLSSETYKGKKVEVKGNQVIIYEENGSKTIETVTDKKEDYKEASESIKNKFDISNLNVAKKAAKTTVAGDMRAKTDEYTVAIVSTKFYRDNKLVATSSNKFENIKKDKKYSFNMEFVGDYSDCSSTVEVEYVK